MSAALLFFFSTGFAVGFGHCIGMCGPIIVALSLKSPGKRSMLPHFLYNGGRIVTYAVLGAIIGATGSLTGMAAHILGIQKTVMIAAGLMVVVTGLMMGGWLPMGRLLTNDSGAVGGWIAKGYNRLSMAADRPGTCFALGLVLGLLPCGPVYTALLMAARLTMTGISPVAGCLTGGAAMAAFGLGTFPALILVARMTSLRWMRSRHLIYRIGALIIVGFGAVFVFQGIRL